MTFDVRRSHVEQFKKLRLRTDMNDQAGCNVEIFADEPVNSGNYFDRSLFKAGDESAVSGKILDKIASSKIIPNFCDSRSGPKSLVKP